jgi:hypothetical protein
MTILRSVSHRRSDPEHGHTNPTSNNRNQLNSYQPKGSWEPPV